MPTHRSWRRPRRPRQAASRPINAYEPGGFEVVAGAPARASSRPAGRKARFACFSSSRRCCPKPDHILLDLGAGVNRSVRRMAAWADTLLVIATEEPTSLTDAYATLKLHSLDRPGGDAARRQSGRAATAPATGPPARSTRACSTFLGRAPTVAGIDPQGPARPRVHPASGRFCCSAIRSARPRSTRADCRGAVISASPRLHGIPRPRQGAA